MRTDQPGGSARTRQPGSLRPRALIIAMVWLMAVVSLPLPLEHGSAQTMLLTPRMLARVVHASPDAPPLDVYLGDIPVVSNSTFGMVSRYLPLNSGETILSIVPAGGDLEQQALAETTVTLEQGQFALILIQGYLNEINLSVTSVDTSKQDDVGYARLRMVHAVPDVPLGDLLLPDGQPVFEGAVSLTTSSYESFQAGQHQLVFWPLRPEGVPDVAISITLVPDVSYDLIMLGDARTGTIHPLAIPTADEQACAQFLGIGDSESGCLTLVHGSRDLGPVDIFFGDEPQLVASGLTFGTASEPIPLPPAAVEVRVVPAGAGLDDDVLTDTALAENGGSLLMVLNGAPDRLSADLFEDDRTPLAGSQSRIQVIHETDGAGTINVTLSGSPLVQALLEAESSDPRLVSGGDYRIEGTSSDDGRVIVTSDKVRLDPGVGYRAVIMGDVEQGVIVLIVGAPVPSDIQLPAP